MRNNHVPTFIIMLKYERQEVGNMKKGQKRRTWTPEEKAEIVGKHLTKHVSVRTLEKEYHADRSMICRWVKKYIAEGDRAAWVFLWDIRKQLALLVASRIIYLWGISQPYMRNFLRRLLLAFYQDSSK